MDKGWLFLLLTELCEVSGTTFLKLSVGFTKVFYSVLSIIFYILTPFFFSLALKRMDISIAYIVSAALGVASVAIVGCLLFGEQMTFLKAMALILIVTGIIMLYSSGVTR